MTTQREQMTALINELRRDVASYIDDAALAKRLGQDRRTIHAHVVFLQEIGLLRLHRFSEQDNENPKWCPTCGHSGE